MYYQHVQLIICLIGTLFVILLYGNLFSLSHCKWVFHFSLFINRIEENNDKLITSTIPFTEKTSYEDDKEEDYKSSILYRNKIIDTKIQFNDDGWWVIVLSFDNPGLMLMNRYIYIWTKTTSCELSLSFSLCRPLRQPPLSVERKYYFLWSIHVLEISPIVLYRLSKTKMTFLYCIWRMCVIIWKQWKLSSFATCLAMFLIVLHVSFSLFIHYSFSNPRLETFHENNKE